LLLLLFAVAVAAAATLVCAAIGAADNVNVSWN
jgi:hypothetical protein